MEQKIITSSSASGLNQKIADLQKEGWEPIGSHSVVVVHEQKRFSGAQHTGTIFEHEYSQTMRRESVPKKQEVKNSNESSDVLEHMLGYLTEEQNKEAMKQGVSGDYIHMLGYLDSKHWIDASKLFKMDDRSELIDLAAKVDNAFGTSFFNEITQL